MNEKTAFHDKGRFGQNVQIVFPTDNRARITPTTAAPYFWVGQLNIRFPSGAAGTGTGTMISQYHVLTCAHNLFQAQYGGWASQVTFSLARDAVTLPYGGPTAVARINVSEEYQSLSPPAPDQQGNVADYTRYAYDYGLVTLQTPFDPSGADIFPPMYPASDQQLNGRAVAIAGYPGDKPAGTMWDGAGNLVGGSEEFLFYQISTYGGNSGSAVRTLFANVPAPTVPRIVGVHVAGSAALNANFACRLTEEKIERITGWM